VKGLEGKVQDLPHASWSQPPLLKTAEDRIIVWFLNELKCKIQLNNIFKFNMYTLFIPTKANAYLGESETPRRHPDSHPSFGFLR